MATPDMAMMSFMLNLSETAPSAFILCVLKIRVYIFDSLQFNW